MSAVFHVFSALKNRWRPETKSHIDEAWQRRTLAPEHPNTLQVSRPSQPGFFGWEHGGKCWGMLSSYGLFLGFFYEIAFGQKTWKGSCIYLLHPVLSGFFVEFT